MPLALEGRTIALAEGRQLEDLAGMFEKEGATIVRCPMLSILDVPDAEPVLNWLGQLIDGKFDYVILLTGEGLRRLMGFAQRNGRRDETLAALKKTQFITRGPKPVQALKELGLAPTKVAVSPTTDGVIATLKRENLSGLTIGVQLYSDSNPPLTDYLVSAGARAYCVQPYYYAPSADAERVSALIRKLDEGQISAIVFTSSPQVERIFEVAREQHLDEALQRGLERTRVAAVGPVVADTLREKGVRVDITPEQGFVMKNLVQYIRRAFEAK